MDLENFQSKFDEEGNDQKLNENINQIDNISDNFDKADDKNMKKKDTRVSDSISFKNKDNVLSWFTYENMLQIIEIDPFNILSIINVDFYSVQEFIFFENILNLKANDHQDGMKNKINQSFYYKNCIIKEYIFDKSNKLLLYLNSNHSIKNKDKNIEKSLIIAENKNKLINQKLNKKEGKFITELKTINEKDEINREELDIKFQIIKKNLEKMIQLFTKIDRLNINIDIKLINKSFLFLGDDETNKIIENFNKAHDLSYIKLCYDFRDLIQKLMQEIIKKKIVIKYRNKNLLHNINFLYRSLNLNNDKKDNFFKRLTLEFPYEKRETILEFNNLIDYLYTFRNRKKILIENYNKEIQDLKNEIEKIIQDSIDNFKTSLFENLKNEKFVKFIILNFNMKFKNNSITILE